VLGTVVLGGLKAWIVSAVLLELRPLKAIQQHVAQSAVKVQFDSIHQFFQDFLPVTECINRQCCSIRRCRQYE